MRFTQASALVILSLLPAGLTRAEEMVNLPVGGESVRAYLLNAPNARTFPGIVLIHDTWGLNEQILGVADRLARLGYVVIAPDLYKGKLAADPGLAKEMMRGLNEERAVSIVKIAVDYLKNLDNAPARPVATVGYGMGGRISLLSALRGADVRGMVTLYGRIETDKEALAPLAAPALGVFGGGDPGIKEKDIRTFESILKESGKDVTVVFYPGIGHGFMDDSRPDFESEMARDAWIRMRDWLAMKLQPAAPAPAAP